MSVICLSVIHRPVPKSGSQSEAVVRLSALNVRFGRPPPPDIPMYLWVLCVIDYHLATASIAALARSEHIYKTVKFRDHAPITVDYEFDL